MKALDGFPATVGNTPLIRLRAASEITGCEILGKAEFLNPGSSVKDRAALFIIRDAEKRGLLRPGGLIVEGTAGNTGIGLALCGNALGYRTLIVIPETQSQEKKDMLLLCGAELKQVPAVPYKNPDNYVHVSNKLAKELADKEENGVLYANQWDNLANKQAHVEGTSKEIWEQTGGQVDAFICSVGTGGTLAGCAQGLRGLKADIVIGLERNGQHEDEIERHTTTVRVIKNRFSGLTGPACRVYYSRESGRLTEVHEDFEELE